MRIAVVRFLINDVGGIDPYYLNLRKGFETLGHEVTLIHSSSATRMKIPRVTARQHFHPGEFKSYRTVSDAEQTRDYLDTFDVVIFLHPSPHPTTEHLSVPEPRNWTILYDLKKARVIQIHHDEKWAQTNSWAKLVADKCELVIAAQHRFLPAVKKYPADCRKEWEYFPLVIPQIGTVQKAVRGIVATQWIQWKNHKLFIPKLGGVQVPIHFYGAGIIYHYLKKDGTLSLGIGYDHTDETRYSDLPHEYFGFVPYPVVQEAMSTSLFSIDLSTRGYTNMTHWEPMLYATIPVMAESVMDDPFNEIPRDCAVTFSNWDHLVEICNSFQHFVPTDVIENGASFIQRCDCRAVAERFLEYLK